MLLSSKWFARIASAVAAACLAGPVSGREDGTVDWLTRAEVQKQLAEPVSVSWSGVPLRRAITNLCRARRVAVLIDRRIDPGQRLDLNTGGAALEDVLREIGRDRRIAMYPFGPILYFGPPKAVWQLHRAAEARRKDLRRLPPSSARRFIKSRRIRWSDFATPRELLAEWSRQSGIEILALDRIPHDLWAAADLPALKMIDQLTLIVGQFDLTFEIAPDGASVRLVPMPDDPPPDGWEKGSGTFCAEHPSGKRFLTPLPMRGFTEERTWTLTVKEIPLDALIGGLAKRLKLEVRIDREAARRAGISLKRRVSLSVKDVTVDELFRAMLTPAGLTFRRQDDTIEIRPAE
jgi:hypothetical protein